MQSLEDSKVALPQPTYTQRGQVQEYRSRLHAASGEPAVQTLLLLLEIHLEKLRSKALTVDKEELHKLQGEAAGYMQVYKWVMEKLDPKVDNTAAPRL